MFTGPTTTADLSDTDFLVERPSDILELVGRGIGAAILSDYQLPADFFDLSTGVAGELVQKCLNYHLRLVIVAPDTEAWSTRFREFAGESTRQGHFVFVDSLESALLRLESLARSAN